MLLKLRKALLVLGLLGGGTVALWPSFAADQPNPAQIQKWIDQLGSGEFEEREEATKKLAEIGVPAYELLKKATQSQDAEIKQRAEDLVSKLARQVESVSLLAPKKVHLVYNNTPLADAVKDFATQSGYSIRLLDPENKLKDRKITLDTGEVPFWEALDRFTQKAELVEDKTIGVGNPVGIVPNRPEAPPIAVPAPLPLRVRPLPAVPAVPKVPVPPPPENKKDELREVVNPVGEGFAPMARVAQLPGEKVLTPVRFDVEVALPPPPPPQVPPAGFQIQANGGVVMINPAAQGANAPAAASRTITLIDGKSASQPADTRSAIRVRISDHVKNQGKPPAKTLRLGLELTAEPRLSLLNTPTIRIDKAIDDQDQTLTQLADGPDNAEKVAPGVVPNGAPVGGPNQILRPAIARRPRPGFPMAVGGSSQLTSFNLTTGTKVAKSLKEVSGVATVQVLKPIEPLITVDDVLKSRGKEFKGKSGGFIKVSEVEQDNNGNTRIKFEFAAPPVEGGANGLNIPMAPLQPQLGVPIQVQIQQQGPVPIQQIAPIMVGGNQNGFNMIDEKGAVIQPFASGQSISQNGQVVKIEQMFTYPKTANKLTRLTYSVQQSATVEVPFTLKNIQVP